MRAPATGKLWRLPGRNALLTLLAMLACWGTARADTSLWEVSRDGKHMYLGGTIHVLRETDHPLPQAFNEAFDEATLIGFETDLNSLNTQQFQQALLSKARYPDSETLEDHLDPEAMAALAAYCEDAGLPLDALLPFKPSFAMLTMLSLELARLGTAGAGVDYHFLQLADAADKPILGLESPEEQLDYLVGMGEGQESEFILHSLQDMSQLNQLLDEMIAAWRKGKSAQLYDLFVAPLKEQYPAIYQPLLVERNENWLPTLEKLLATDETELVLVGVAHLVGPDGLLEMLRDRGYTIEQR